MRRLASGTYVQVALAVKDHMTSRPQARILLFDDASGAEMDFDLRGSGDDVAARIAKRYPTVEEEVPRAPGRPKLGVIAREVTLLPRHWDWLGEQPGGASVTLRKLVEDARRAGLTDKSLLRKLQERTYRFMSAIAGNLPGFEEASRALFANNIARLREETRDWPADVREHIGKLWSDIPVR